jgi:hypothetical protein
MNLTGENMGSLPCAYGGRIPINSPGWAADCALPEKAVIDIAIRDKPVEP